MLVQVTLLDAMLCLGRRRPLPPPAVLGGRGALSLQENGQVYNTERDKRLILKG